MSAVYRLQENESDSSSDIIVRLLLAIDRRTNLEDAWDTLNLATEVNQMDKFKGLVVGLDLSGDPTV